MNTTLRKRAKIIHDRAIESLKDAHVFRMEGKKSLAMRYFGRYQGYYDAWVLLNHFLLQSTKGGD